MLAALPLLPAATVAPAVAAFLCAVRSAGFSGDIETSEAARLAVATDNSIYQVLPAAVVLPRSTADVCLLLRVAQQHPSMAFTARGGGTSTNGQCLTHGVVIDHSRHHDRICSIDPLQRLVRVEPGVVLDRLSSELQLHGLQIGPTLSTSSRATIGGMVGTDAAGKGSRIYGKTSCHIEELEIVLADGTLWTSRALTDKELHWLSDLDDAVGQLHRAVVALVDRTRDLVTERFPRLTRFLAGYNLARVRQDDGRFNLNWLIAGAEGTLAVVTGITLRAIPIPAAKRLVVIGYPTFEAALADARELLRRDPQAIETIDSTVISLAKTSVLWPNVAPLLPHGEAFNLVQFAGDEATHLATIAAGLSGLQHTSPLAIAACWDVRKAGVGLLGALPGARKPLPFVEDTVVPPEHLAAYVQEFRQLLDRHGLRYGMFGHVDVGCLHVRPALDLTDPLDEVKVRQITDAVVALTKKYGGLLWGEHGKGFRGEYLSQYIGEDLYQAFRAVKQAFDPHNRLNPGKLVTPCGCDEHPLKIDEVPLRGQADRQIPRSVRATWSSAIDCNGNGACHAPDPDTVMCPSSKLTKDRIHTPKGRAGLVREWLRRVSVAGYDARRLPASRIFGEAPIDDFTAQVKSALDGCLSCKGCSGQCPVKVDVPDLKSHFLAHYHGRFRRPLRDWAVAGLEIVAPLAARWPRLANVLPTPDGLVDLPQFSVPSWHTRRPPGRATLDEAHLIIVPDVFTTCYDADVLEAAVHLLAILGWRVHVAPLVANGKPLHVLGMLRGWQRTARTWRGHLERLAATGKPLLALEPAVALTQRDELTKAFGESPVRLHLLGEWLVKQFHTSRVPRAFPPSAARDFFLLAHCTEQATAPAAAQAWVEIFRRCGQRLTLARSGCCGMAGVWGHQQEHAADSRALFALSWAPQLAAADAAGAEPLADGFSCRHQTLRCAKRRIRHPIEALVALASSISSDERGD